MSSKLIYYVYAYLRNKDSKTAKAGTPYYIGKGKGNRAFAPHTNLPLPADKCYIIFVESNLSNVGALALERRLIRWYGRIDKNTGILRNRTDGGDGVSLPGKLNGNFGKSPTKGVKLSEEHRRKISEATKGRVAPNKGIPRTADVKERIGNAHRGKVMSDDARMKMKSAWTDERRAAHSARNKIMNEKRREQAKSEGRPYLALPNRRSI